MTQDVGEHSMAWVRDITRLRRGGEEKKINEELFLVSLSSFAPHRPRLRFTP
jgi:hypothetical protein